MLAIAPAEFAEDNSNVQYFGGSQDTQCGPVQ